MPISDINQAIKNPKMRVFRRAYIKRRLTTTGLFEDDWQPIAPDVKRWGSVRMSADSERVGKFTLDGMRLVMHNDSGRYNPSDDPNSLWYGYLDQPRTLVKIEAGFEHLTLGADGIWSKSEFPSSGRWDEDEWDEGLYDSSPILFTGILSGDNPLSDRNEVTLEAKTLVQVFKDFPARVLTGYGPSLTASGFMQMLRDQTDGAGSFVFRPFFGDTTTNWDISTTSSVYANLSTSTGEDIINATVWDIVEKLAEAENFTAYVDQQGKFKFTSREAGSSTAFAFHGLGSFDSTHGHTIKSISRFGKDIGRYYSAVQVRFNSESTSTSYAIEQATFQVSPTNAPWSLGHKVLNITNYWIPNSTVAGTLARAIYTDVSSLKNMIEFSTSFVPHLNLLDRVSLHYDSTTRAQAETLWDANDWDTELTWDYSEGDAIVLDGDEYKFTSIDINLDTFECKYVARAI